MTDSKERTRIAVLGGGVGSIATAFELTATPELRERFDVTVYQLGWRIGGKGASGRNMEAGGRIEEHGLHVWFGFYDNAFRLMREAYKELGRKPGAPLATLEDAFKPCDEIVLYDRQGQGWHAAAFKAPENSRVPGVSTRLPTFWEIAQAACRWVIPRWQELAKGRAGVDFSFPAAAFTPHWFANLAEKLRLDVLDLEMAGAERLLRMAEQLATARSRHTDPSYAEHAQHPDFLVELLTGFRDWLWKHVVAARCDQDPELRMFFTIFDTITTTAAGLVADGLLEPDHGFDEINDEEWAAWLKRHGAHEVTLGTTPEVRAPVLRSVYDVAFGYVDGDIAKANVAAGTAINDLLRLVFTYRGALMWKMQAGMGDTVFTPFYEVLKARKVKFEFFHAVTNLGLSAGGDEVETIEVVPQVKVKRGEYKPLVPVQGLDCWPSEPLWDQLVDGKRHRKDQVDFEAEANPLKAEAMTLKRGQDFDQVVLGISVAALPEICDELMKAKPRFREMIENSVTVRTQAFQLWLREPTKDLGWQFDVNSVAGCYVEPLDTYCAMDHLLPRETWSDKDDVHSIAYFCGVLDEPRNETAEQTTERVKHNAIEFLERDAGPLWPKAVTGPNGPLRWDLLADGRGRVGKDRFDAQFWRANTTMTERYVLTPATSVKHRLAPGDSGFDNLVLAGDWTKNGIDGGCVEAAAISGIQAAQALTDHDRPIVGEDPTWLTQAPSGLPRYVEYGGRATSPGPFHCTRGRFRGLIVKGDEERIRSLVRRTLTGPAEGSVEYRPLCHYALVLVGQFGSVTSRRPPYDRWGAVRETCASIFIPVVAGKQDGPFFVADRLCIAAPYVLVDNPMSYLGGREDYGYPKTMARFDPAEGFGERVRIHAYGGDFSPQNLAEWRPLIEIAPGDPGGRGGNEAAREGPDEFVRYLADGAFDGVDEPIIGSLKLGITLIAEMLKGQGNQVFLKQFRDIADGEGACYQSVVEAPLTVERVSVQPSKRKWNLIVHPLDSHPIAEELGVSTQSASRAFDLEMDFMLETGQEIHRARGVGGEVPGGPGAADGPHGGSVLDEAFGMACELMEAAGRRAFQELDALRRRRWW